MMSKAIKLYLYEKLRYHIIEPLTPGKPHLGGTELQDHKMAIVPNRKYKSILQYITHEHCDKQIRGLFM